METNIKQTKTEIYRGYEIRTAPNGQHFTSLIYKENVPVGGTFSDAGKENSVEKAKAKIDNYNA